MQPTIDGVLRSMGSDADDTMRLKAKVLAARAIRTYQPERGAGVHTWVSQQLQPLRRFKRTALQPVRVPERMQLEAFHIMQGEAEFRDKFNREPDLDELADYTKIPPRRIEGIRRGFRKVVAQGAFGEAASMPEMVQTDYSDEALDYLYRDADRIDRKIIEMKTGYGGAFEPMQPQDIAIRLNLSPVQLSRRSARLATQLDTLRNAIQSVTQ